MTNDLRGSIAAALLSTASWSALAQAPAPMRPASAAAVASAPQRAASSGYRSAFDGYRRFEVDDASTNEFVTTILTFGEGLHNNHHRFPRDAYISHAWWEIDLNGLIILGLEKIGLVHDVFHASHRQLERAEAQAASTAR